MTSDEMTFIIEDIHSQVFRDRDIDNYASLLDAVEELRYFLVYDLQVTPTPPEIIPDGHFTF